MNAQLDLYLVLLLQRLYIKHLYSQVETLRSQWIALK